MVRSPNLHFPFIPHIVTLTLVHPSDVLGLLLRNGFAVQLHQLLDTCLLASPDVNQVLALTGVPIVSPIKKKYFHLVIFKSSTLKKIILDFLIHCLFKLLFSEESELFFYNHSGITVITLAFLRAKRMEVPNSVSQTIGQESFLEYPISDCGSLLQKDS